MADRRETSGWEWSPADWEWVQEALAEHQASVQHVERLGLKGLTPGLKLLIWGLRIYVLFMAVVVIVNVVQTVH
ncbi:MAG: hypothetical protein OWU84_03895 [Firmicutes bacterium]|nr:hypothetical protein [Bacillota bacterium]